MGTRAGWTRESTHRIGFFTSITDQITKNYSPIDRDTLLYPSNRFVVHEQQGGERVEGGERRENKRTMEREEGKGEGIEKGGDARL